MVGSLYSDYEARKPHKRLEFLIYAWHDRLLWWASNAASISPNSRILEIGPGHGFFARQCIKKGYRYQAIDTSPAVVETLRADGIMVELTDLEKWSNSEKYDVVWLSHVLEHMQNWAMARDLILSVTQKLTQDGIVVVVSPDILSWKQHFWDVDWSHGYQTSIRSCVQLLNDVGFSVEVATHHRGAYTGFIPRTLLAASSLLPHTLLDRVVTPKRAAKGDGFFYTWKVLFAWRQILIIGRNSPQK